ncbi:MAG: flippase-like domain-containing protein [Candidatus Rokubacteria bacterium]|nr:flippase-like domain-containing protein [Candidatus Rokubacteria bacterium]
MNAMQALAAAAGLGVIALLVWEVGPAGLLAQVRELSWRLPVLLLPYGLVAVLDAAGWRYAFPGRLPPLRLLVAARLAGEAVNATTPTATLGGEPLKAWLLTQARVPFEEGLVSVVVAKTALVVSHLGFLAFALALAFWAPAAPALLASMVILMAVGVVAIGGFVWTQQRGLFGASGRALAWLGIRGRVAGHLGRLDDHLRTYYRSQRGRLGLALLFHFLGWVAGSAEVWLALRFLGSPVDLATAVVIEALGSAIRSATFLIPASLGVQEGGFVGIFVGFGLGAGAGLAFGLIRRIREILWAVVGYAFLVAWRGPRGAAISPDSFSS